MDVVGYGGGACFDKDLLSPVEGLSMSGSTIRAMTRVLTDTSNGSWFDKLNISGSRVRGLPWVFVHAPTALSMSGTTMAARRSPRVAQNPVKEHNNTWPNC